MSGGGLADLRIDGDRLWRRIEALGAVGAVHGPGGERGCARLALTEADGEGRDVVVSWMTDLGMDVGIDRIGNVVATHPGVDADAAPVMVGSHIDTVRTGGRFDGNLGVLAGLEIVETLIDAGARPRRPIAVAFFTDEEGVRFPPDMLGSLAFVGGMAIEEALDIRAVDGARLGDELVRIGYAGALPCPTDRAPFAYLELHIEQGPVLEDEGLTIGVVTGVQGISWTEVRLTGQSAHAGTTPMRLRRDPGVVAAEIIGFARRLAGELGDAQVATVGRCDFVPDMVNVVPAEVTLTLDLRNTSEEALQRAEQRMADFVGRAAAAETVSVETRSLARFAPVEFDEATVRLIESTALALGLRARRMPSGAGHDAQMLARICPSAMVFVPSVNGLSHNIAEHTTPGDVEAGANVLLHSVLRLADR